MKTKIPAGFSVLKKGKLRFLSCDQMSGIPGFTQVFTTRLGGVSGMPFSGLNIGVHTDDKKSDVQVNIRMIEKALGIKYLGAARQVHGDTIIILKDKPQSKNRINNLSRLVNTDADGLITNIKGLAVGVRLADCVGTVIMDPGTKTVASVHSGWRGIANKITSKTVRTMISEFKSNPADLIAAISPAIGPCCYEVGEDVYNQLHMQAVFSKIFHRMNGHIYMNLWQGVKNLLLAEGLKKKNIHICSMCTSDNPEYFYSHRRDKGKTGRMMALGVFTK
jgi:polyphenol oxidase